MLNWLGVALLVAGFVVLVKLFSLVSHSKAVIAQAHQSARVLRDPDLSDLDKEKQLQRATVQLFKGFFIILSGSAAALALPAGLVWLLDWAGVLSFDATLALTLSWPFIVGISVAAIVVTVVVKQRQKRGV